jgi:DNA-binding response OmpR family regulator
VDKRRVLIVEDEPHIVLALEFLLQREGYETATAGDGDEALALARRLGYEVCQAIKADPELAAVPVIMLSAKGQEVEVLKGLELGAAAYVTKPFGNVEIVEAVRAALGPRA